MQNKYNLTLEQSIFLAKRNLGDNIYANAKMEGVNVPNLKIDEIQFIFDNCIDGITFEE